MVDFIDGNPNDQQSLFGKSKWEEMQQHFMDKYAMTKEPKL